jgi:hypothetical protein
MKLNPVYLPGALFNKSEITCMLLQCIRCSKAGGEACNFLQGTSCTVTNERLRRPLTSALYHAPQQAANFTFVKKGSRQRGLSFILDKILPTAGRQAARLTSALWLPSPVFPGSLIHLQKTSQYRQFYFLDRGLRKKFPKTFNCQNEKLCCLL